MSQYYNLKNIKNLEKAYDEMDNIKEIACENFMWEKLWSAKYDTCALNKISILLIGD